MGHEADDPSPRLLVVDDEPELLALLCEYLAGHGLAVQAAADAAQARQYLVPGPGRPDLVILDLRMPGESGLSLARWLRQTHPGIGLLMLTSAASTADRITGLEQGADDYLPKPFETRELLARVRALLRRLGWPAGSPLAATPGQAASAPRLLGQGGPVLQFGRCTLDLAQRSLRDGQGAEVALTPAEFDLLALFARYPHQPLHRDRIMEEAHHRSWSALDRSIDLRIMRLRRKIEHNPDLPETLKTVRNVGYVFVPS